MSIHLFEERDYKKPYVQSTSGNQIWRRVSYSYRDKQYVPDPQGELRHVATTSGLPSSAEERGAYTGGFPSKDVCEFINAMKSKMIYFDDGKRMRYSKYTTPPHILTPLELYQSMTRMM